MANPFLISNGVPDITIKPAPNSINGAEVNNKPYVSGMLQTASSFSQLHGYFETNAELPVGNGVGGAFWLLPKDGSWPPEIDVEENLGQNPGTIYQTLHDGTPGNVSNLQIPVSGAAQDSGFNVAMTAGTHGVAVSFLNDAWAGTSDTDRNLYVNAINANGAAIPGTAATLFSTGTQHFSIVVGTA